MVRTDDKLKTEHSCKFCSLAFVSLDALQSHIAAKHSCTAQACYFCGYVYTDQYLLQVHIVNGHTPNNSDKPKQKDSYTSTKKEKPPNQNVGQGSQIKIYTNPKVPIPQSSSIHEEKTPSEKNKRNSVHKSNKPGAKHTDNRENDKKFNCHVCRVYFRSQDDLQGYVERRHVEFQSQQEDQNKQFNCHECKVFFPKLTKSQTTQFLKPENINEML